MPGSHNCSSCEISTLETSSVLFAMENYVIPIVVSLGIGCNILALMVLRKLKEKSTFHQSLLALATCDICFLSLILMDYSKQILIQFHIIVFPYFLNPMLNIFLCLGSFLIMSITTERFLAIYKPFLYRTHKLRHSARVHLLTYILPPVILAVLINIPKFLEAEFNVRNKTSSDNISIEALDFTFTSLRINPIYIYFYTHWTRLLITGILPFSCLLVMNILIFITINRSKRLTIKYQANTIRSRKFSKSTLTLASIVFLYLVCNTPRLLLNCVEYYYFSAMMESDFCLCSWTTYLFELLLIINHLFLVINSSANIFIYFLTSKTFKQTLLLKLRLTRKNSISNNATLTLGAQGDTVYHEAIL